MGLRRLFAILIIVCRYRVDLLIPQERLPLQVRLFLRFGPWRLFPAPDISRGERLRLALEALGPIFIKFGQILSTRRDLLPDDIADELAHLQDRVPPFPSEQAVAQIEKALGRPVDEIFDNFDRQALASASIAQVHTATLKSGDKVVVKVVRPGIERTISDDVRLMAKIAELVERHLPDGRRLRPVEVVEDYQHTIYDELDLQREGANTSQLRRNFANSDILYVPEVYWDYTRRNVLVMERIHGIPVTDVERLRRDGTDMKKLAERGVEIFFTQVFRDSFFHADMHPGNIFIAEERPLSPQYIAIDCAIIGSLSDFDQYYLARNLLAIFQRNYREVAELHVECGWVPAHTKVHEFEAAIRSVSEPIFEKPLADISFGQLLLYLFQTARRFDMEVQPSLVLLQKTLLNIEGLGRQLYPQLDLWSTAMPFLEQWVRDRYSPQTMLRRVSHRLPGLLEQLPHLPESLLERGQLPQRGESEATRELFARFDAENRARERRSRNQRLAILALIAAALFTDPAISASLNELPPISIGLGLAAIYFFIRAR
ncbi:ubiquinone biosynthesis regulatory protein kinase UbiB [Spongiibacter sp. KMU-166]|uniref:Probable protein kinase UbiB n=1 Tax=Spongiibacter thalassae TaxID=2721624 RepID=A0ABX1GM71_9GAMM|nr:ubiquinone biosynthesis regulatory protein kinase UbiB [Spongiibacter thalassae]NKI19488.1 ubiquinone biosynthesis regulatory protein kinase UbiB [Spongiibacter thalassae]